MSSKRLQFILGGLLFNIHTLSIFMSRHDYPDDMLSDNRLWKNILDSIKQVYYEDNIITPPLRFIELCAKSHNISVEDDPDNPIIEKYKIFYRKAKAIYETASENDDYLDRWKAEVRWAIKDYIRFKRKDLAEIEYYAMKHECFGDHKKTDDCKECEIKALCYSASKKDDKLEFVQNWRELNEGLINNLQKEDHKLRIIDYSHSLKERCNEYDEQFRAKKTSNKSTMGVPWSIPSINRWTDGHKQGRLMVIAGRTGSGKTALALQECFFAYRYGGVNVLYINLEMPKGEMNARLDALRTATPFTNVLNQRWDEGNAVTEYKDFKRALIRDNRDADPNLVFRILDTGSFNITDFKNVVRQHYRLWGSNFIVCVDNINIMTFPDDKDLDIAVNHAAQTIHATIKDYDIYGLLLAQLNRSAEKTKGRIMAAHFRDCDKIPDHADGVFAITDLGVSGRKKVQVVKGRSFQLGEYVFLENRLDIMQLIEVNAPVDSDNNPASFLV